MLDKSLGGVEPSVWVEGAAETGPSGFLRIRGKKLRTIEARRCVACGTIELVAPTTAREIEHCLKCHEPLSVDQTACTSCGWTWE